MSGKGSTGAAGMCSRVPPSATSQCRDLTVSPIPTAVKEAAVQRKHNLYRDSMVMHNSDPNLHLLAEGAPIDWGEEYGGGGDDTGSPGSPEKRRRAKHVVSVVQEEENAPMSLEASPEPLSPASPDSVTEVRAASPDSVTEIRGLLAQDQRVESSPPATGPLLNGVPMQENPQPEGAPSPPASPLRHTPPAKATGLEGPKPSDQETGEQVSSPGGRPPIHTTTEDSAGVQTEF